MDTLSRADLQWFLKRTKESRSEDELLLARWSESEWTVPDHMWCRSRRQYSTSRKLSSGSAGDALHCLVVVTTLVLSVAGSASISHICHQHKILSIKCITNCAQSAVNADWWMKSHLRFRAGNKERPSCGDLSSSTAHIFYQERKMEPLANELNMIVIPCGARSRCWWLKVRAAW